LAESDVTIRRCTYDDIDAVLRLWSLARSQHARTPDRREDIESLVEGSPAALFVAEAEKGLVGAVIAGWDGWRGNIYRLAIRQDIAVRASVSVLPAPPRVTFVIRA
jgi:ribosomal protein S18 acetylase RimI-like enzyme